MLAGLMLLSAVREVWQFYAVFGVVLAAAVSMTHFVPNTALVRKWFIAKAGLATGLVTVGTVTGFACLPPAISRMSAALGWRYATLFCALGFGVFILLGFAYSAPFSLYTPFLGDLFGRTIVGTLMGVLTLGHGIIGGIGPYLWGWIADRTGSYILNCPISALCYALVVLALYLLKPPVPSTSK
jgi:hypothetical protein